MDRREFWTTKSPLAEYHAVTFDHPAFSETFRLVANQFAEVTLGGNVHTPTSMTIKAPDQKGDGQAKLTLGFPRQVVGREFKRQLALVAASSSRAPITVLYEVYLGNKDTPQVTWKLYVSEVGGVTFTTEAVQVTASDDNPMRRAVAPIYDPSVFSGLELI